MMVLQAPFRKHHLVPSLSLRSFPTVISSSFSSSSSSPSSSSSSSSLLLLPPPIPDSAPHHTTPSKAPLCCSRCLLLLLSSSRSLSSRPLVSPLVFARSSDVRSFVSRSSFPFARVYRTPLKRTKRQTSEETFPQNKRGVPLQIYINVTRARERERERSAAL